MSCQQYNLGALVTVRGAFTDPATAAAIDPDVIKLSVLTPDGVVTTYVYGTDDLVKKTADTTGQYSADLNAQQAGWWYYRWWSEGIGQAAREGRFKVRAPKAI